MAGTQKQESQLRLVGRVNETPATKSVVPKNYLVDIRASPSRDHFEGTVQVDLELVAPVHNLALNVRGVELSNVGLKFGTTKMEPEVRVDQETETATLVCGDAVGPGSARLSIFFYGRVHADSGLYRLPNGDEYALCTGSTPSHTRKLFPCFDNRRFKTSVLWTVRTEGKVTVLCNGLLERTSTRGTTRVWNFKKTQPIFPQQLALAIGNFVSSPHAQVNNTPVLCFSLQRLDSNVSFVHTQTQKLLAYYASHFKSQYRHEKFDYLVINDAKNPATKTPAGLALLDASLLQGKKQQLRETIASQLVRGWLDENDEAQIATLVDQAICEVSDDDNLM